MNYEIPIFLKKSKIPESKIILIWNYNKLYQLVFKSSSSCSSEIMNSVKKFLKCLNINT